MHHVRAEALVAVISGKRHDAVRQIEDWDLLTRKLQVGVLLRNGRVSDEVRQSTEQLRDALEELRDFVLANRMDEARELQERIEAVYFRCRELYLPDKQVKVKGT